MKWSALFDKEIPQELLAEIELQRDSCERIIQSKDRLIKEFKTELKSKDDEYVKALKKQNDDIELLWIADEALQAEDPEGCDSAESPNA